MRATIESAVITADLRCGLTWSGGVGSARAVPEPGTAARAIDQADRPMLINVAAVEARGTGPSVVATGPEAR